MNSNDIAKADGLSENDLELLGISEPTTKKAAPRLNNRWWPVAILVLTAVLFQLIVVSCQRSSSALREGESENDARQYSLSIADESWATRLPKSIPPNATDVHFRARRGGVDKGETGAQLGVTLPHEDVVKLVSDLKTEKIFEDNIPAATALIDPLVT
jgi:hypothetical protein